MGKELDSYVAASIINTKPPFMLKMSLRHPPFMLYKCILHVGLLQVKCDGLTPSFRGSREQAKIIIFRYIRNQINIQMHPFRNLAVREESKFRLHFP